MGVSNGRELWANRRGDRGIQLVPRAREGGTQAAPDDDEMKRTRKLTGTQVGRLMYLASKGDKDAAAALARHAAKTDGDDAA